jgi:SPP1 family predicted phage head-tail adaptor
MRAGQRDRLIVLQFKTQGTSASGEPTDAWGGDVPVFASVRGLSGREYYSAAAAQLVADEMLIFGICYRADVRVGVARVVYGGRIYSIRHAVELGRQVDLEIQGETVTA